MNRLSVGLQHYIRTFFFFKRAGSDIAGGKTNHWYLLKLDDRHAGSGGGFVAKACPTLAAPWTVARQAPLSMGLSRQGYCSGLPFSV